MTANLLLKRLLGEAAANDPVPSAPPPAGTTPTTTTTPEEREAEPISDAGAATPTTQELIQQWKAGDHMAVAARLMFTEASYADFVDLCFVIGHSDARQLGQMLDEMADTENMEPPETPPEYAQALASVGGEKEGVL